MRSDLELLKALHTSLINELMFLEQGLCDYIDKMRRTSSLARDEYRRLGEVLHQNKPLGASSFDLWWPEGHIKPRVKFIQDLIKKYEQTNMPNL